MSKLRALDLYCSAGGATRGYQLAGFHVTGVDIKPQPRYVGDAFIQGDALAYVREHGHEFDLIHASPPCQRYMRLAGWSEKYATKAPEYPDLVAPTREALVASGRPYIIENVPDAPLLEPLMLCGSMFEGLRVIRHRIFETSARLAFAPASCSHPRGAVGRRGNEGTREWITVTGHFAGVPKAQVAMGGLDWMTQADLAQAIPPAFTHYIATELLAAGVV